MEKSKTHLILVAPSTDNELSQERLLGLESIIANNEYAEVRKVLDLHHNRHIIKHIHLGRQVETLLNTLNVPLRSIWDNSSKLLDINFIAGHNYIFIIEYTAFRTSNTLMNKVRKKASIAGAKVTCVLITYDVLKRTNIKFTHNSFINALMKRGVDYIGSFSNYDVQMFKNAGFDNVFEVFTPMSRYDKVSKYSGEIPKQQVLCIANPTTQWRFNLTNAVYNILRQHNISAYFHLPNYVNVHNISIDLRKNSKIPHVDYSLSSYLGTHEHPSVIDLIKNSNVLLDIGQYDSSVVKGYSYRVYQAILYNKKLITTSKYVTEFKYYNPEYIKIIENPENIEHLIGWINQDIDVDYHYDGEFSLTRFLDLIYGNVTG